MTILPPDWTASAERVGLRPRARVIAGDLVIGAAIVTGLWFTAAPAEPAGRLWQAVLAGAALAAVGFRRRLPRAATAVATAATALAWALGMTADPGVMIGLCLFAVAELRSTRAFPWWVWLASGALAALALFIGGDLGEDGLQVAVLAAVVVSAAWALGTRSRQVALETAARARAEERLRLTRDVHDVLSHSLGTIGVQAGVAAHVTAMTPDALRAALRTVEEDARASLDELRELLRAERLDLEAGRGAASRERDLPDDVPIVPVTAAIGTLRERLQRTGIRVIADLPPAVDRLPIGHQQLVQRIVQEASTNVIRHSGASLCRINVRVDAGGLVVEVLDDGHGAEQRKRDASPAEGHGLLGMRERVALFGGSLDAGNAAEGFRVRASVPLDAEVEP